MNLSRSSKAPGARPPRPGQRGATLIEVLVSILLFSFGILGLVGLQARATQFSLDAEDRNRAALFADDLAAQMRLARSVALGAAQIDAWTRRVQGVDAADQPTGLGLPNAVVDVTPDLATNTAIIEIEWRHPRQADDETSRLRTQVVLTNEETT